MEHASHADSRAKTLGIDCDCHDRFGRCFEQQAVHRPLVPIGDAGDLGWQGEDHVEVSHGQQIVGAGRHPVPRGWPLAFRAMPVLARVIGNVLMVAFGASRHMSPERLGPAGLNR
jgi:hypothetical protein